MQLSKQNIAYEKIVYEENESVKAIKDTLKQTYENAPKEESTLTTASDGTVLEFDSPYERFYSCLKSGVWDEMSLKIKEKYPKDYQRALENFNLLERGA